MRQFINLVESAPDAAWFAGSQIVDAAGEPLRVYHGTTRSFDEFQRQSKPANGYLWDDHGLGYFFTPNAGTRSDSGPWSGAAGYAGVNQRDGETVGREGANIRPTYLAIKNPYTFDYASFIEAVKQAGNGDELRERLEALGYDGVIRLSPSGKIDTIVAFDPSQIRSALAPK